MFPVLPFHRVQAVLQHICLGLCKCLPVAAEMQERFLVFQFARCLLDGINYFFILPVLMG